MDSKFKVGDRVLMHSTPLSNLERFRQYAPGGHGFKPNVVLTIREIFQDDDYNVMYFKEIPQGIYEGNFSLVNESKLSKIWF